MCLAVVCVEDGLSQIQSHNFMIIDKLHYVTMVSCRYNVMIYSYLNVI